MITQITKYHVVAGRAFKILAEFPDTPQGTDEANIRMSENDNLSVLAVQDGVVILCAPNDAGESVERPVRLLCSCCGGRVFGRQWHNRDLGYGLCDNCIDFCSRNTSPEEFERCYGKLGIHYAAIGTVPVKP